MEEKINPSGDFLFKSVRQVADNHGQHLDAPKTEAQWKAVRDQITVLMDAPKTLTAPGIRAAPPGFKSENPSVESEPAEIQAAVDSNRADFNRRANRLSSVAATAMKAAEAKDPLALMRALDGVDKACESCHLHYFYPRDKRAQLAAKEDHIVD